MEIQKRGRWRSEKSVRKYEKHARLLKETCETVDCHAKIWATVDEPHAAIARRGTTPSPASADQTGSQPRIMSESRCRAKLHGIFKQAQRHSRDGRFFLLVGGPARLVSGQIARLSSLGIVVLSGVLSPDFDLNSSTVPTCLVVWVTHGDIAAVWMTQPLALSTGSCLLEACQQAAIAGVHEDLHNDIARHLHAATKNLAVRQVPADLCAFGFPFKKRLTWYIVCVPLYLKLAQRGNNFDHICSFSGQAHQRWKGHFIHRAHRVRYSLLVHLFTCSMARTVGVTNIAGWAESRQGHRWSGRGMQYVVCVLNTHVFDDNVRHVCDTCFDKGKTESCLVKAPAMHASESVLVVSELLCTGVQANAERHAKNETREMCSCWGYKQHSSSSRNSREWRDSNFQQSSRLANLGS